MGFNLFFYLFTFLLGLAIGSFLNCIIYRLEIEENFLKGRSYCPYCKHKLSWKDLIPVLSFVILGGKCRYCQKRISLQYPFVEILTGVLFALVAFHTLPDLGLTIYYLLLSAFMIIIFVYDLKHYIIPDEIIYPAIVIALVFNCQFLIFNQPSIFISAIFSALGASAFFLAIFLISTGKWIGFGDVKLAFFMGFFLGFPDILVGLFFSFFIGAIIGLGLIFTGKKTLKSQVPFGPFLVGGTFIAFFLGNQIVNWYLNIFI